MTNWKLLSAAAAGIIGLVITSARADMIAFTEAGTPTQVAGQGLVAFEFTPTQNIYVTKLGFFALNLGSGDTPHVALISVPGSIQNNPPTVLYDTGTLNPGTLTNDAWNYVNFSSPIELIAGNTYEVAAPLYWTNQYSSTSGFTYGNGLSSETLLHDGGWNGWDNTNGGVVYNYTTLTPDTVVSGYDVSANFQYVFPEPASLGLAGLGGVALLLRRRKS